MAAVPSTRPASVAANDAHGLYERHYPLVLRFCRSKLRTPEDAEDAAQTTFFYALGSLSRGTVPETETAWLLTIARNVCLNRWDATRRRSRVEVARDPHVLQEVSPAREDAAPELIGLADALAGLTDPQRQAILLREWQGLSYAEIAAELELTEGAVETLLFRARRALARSLRDLGSAFSGIKSLLGGAGALKVAAGIATVAAVGVVAAPQVERKQRPPLVRPALDRPTRGAVPAPLAPPRVARTSSSRTQKLPALSPVGASPGRARRSDSPVPSNSGPAGASAPPEAPARPRVASDPATPDSSPGQPPPPARQAPPVLPAPTVQVPQLAPVQPALPVSPPVDLPALPELPKVELPAVTVPLPKLP